MKKKQLIAGCALLFIGCFGGGVSADKVGGSTGNTDALVQTLPYEVLRNRLITVYGLTDTSKAILALDKNAPVFGKPTSPGGPRNLSVSLSWLKVLDEVCNEAAVESLSKIPDQFFDTGSFSPDKAYLRIVGRPITAEQRAVYEKTLALEGFASNSQKQLALVYLMCRGIPQNLS